MSHDLALRQSKEPRAAAKNFVQTRGLLADLQRVTMSNRSLHREQTVVSNMARGLEVVLKMKKSGLAAAYLHQQLNKAAPEEDAEWHRQVHEDLKEITSVKAKTVFLLSLLGTRLRQEAPAYPNTNHRQHVRAVQCEGVSLQIRIRRAGVKTRNAASVLD